MTDQTELTFPGVTFECHVLVGFTKIESFYTPSEDEAIEWARARVSPYVTQVTIEACGPVTYDFAIRHITPAGDSGWRCWREGTLTGSNRLETVFGERQVSA